MQIKIVGLHAPHAPRLQALLGAQHTVDGLAAFPAQGVIEADVVIANAISAEQARRVRCKLVHVPGAGTEQVAIEALPAASRVCNVHGHEVPIAEFVIHAILEHMLALWECPAVLDETAFPRVYARRPMHEEAAAKTLVLIGYGHIGRAVARRARALDMRVIAVTRSGALPDDGQAERCVPVACLHDVLPQANVLLLCCPLDDTTRGLVGAAELNLLPPNALLVNVARAEVAQEQALYEALAQGRLGRAALDVWYQYPKPGQAELAPSRLPFHDLPNVRATPHMSALTPGLLERRYGFMAANILRLQAGEPLLNVVRDVA